MILTRFAYTPHGTFGRLNVSGMTLYTVERPWANNAPNDSCIPVGTYRLEKTTYYRGGYDTFEVCDVPDRSRILIHVGNTMDDLLGCIAPGLRLGWVAGRWAVVSSKPAFRALMERGKNAAMLEIGNYQGGTVQ